MSMKKTKKMQRLLEQMARIERMERGTLSRMGARPYYNHQTWQKGRNVVRYVPAQEVDFLKEAIEGYNLFMELAQRYADEVIKQTRKQRKKLSPKPQRKTNRANKKGQSGKIRPQGPI
jgi:hypothetical protein